MVIFHSYVSLPEGKTHVSFTTNVLRLLATEPPGTQRSPCEIAGRFSNSAWPAQVEWDLDSSSIRCGFLSVSWLAEKILKNMRLYDVCYMMLYDVLYIMMLHVLLALSFFFLHHFSINFLVSVAKWGWAAGPLVFPNASRSPMEALFHDVPWTSWWIDMNRCELMWNDVKVNY